MGRRSSIQRLPAEVKEAYLRLAQDGKFTIEQIVEHMNGLGAKVSWSAVQRDLAKREKVVERHRLAREMALALGKELQDVPEEDHERATQEILMATLLQASSNLAQLDEPDMGELLNGALAMDKLAAAKKKNVETFRLRAKIREEERARAAQDAAKAAEEEAAVQGLSQATVDAIRARILGIARAP